MHYCAKPRQRGTEGGWSGRAGVVPDSSVESSSLSAETTLGPTAIECHLTLHLLSLSCRCNLLCGAQASRGSKGCLSLDCVVSSLCTISWALGAVVSGSRLHVSPGSWTHLLLKLPPPGQTPLLRASCPAFEWPHLVSFAPQFFSPAYKRAYKQSIESKMEISRVARKGSGGPILFMAA